MYRVELKGKTAVLHPLMLRVLLFLMYRVELKVRWDKYLSCACKTQFLMYRVELKVF